MKRVKSLLMAVLFCLTAMVSALPVLVAAPRNAVFANAATASTNMPAFSISNADFNKNSPSDGEPISPTDWTGAYGSNFSGQDIKAGLVNLSKAASSQTQWGLDKNTQLPAYSDKIDKALLINSGVRETVYTYKSSSFDIAPNSYLHISFQAHANLTSGQVFAYFDTTELDVTSLPVRTKDGWTTYHLFVKSHAFSTISTPLVFSLGSNFKVKNADGIEKEESKPASGYVFVRDIQSMLLTPADYEMNESRYTDNETALFSAADVVTSYSLKSDLEQRNQDMWKESGNFKRINTAAFDTDEKINDTALKNPDSPFSDDSFVMAVRGSSSNSPSSASLTTKDGNDLTVPRFGYVRVSLWVNTVNLMSGSASFKITKGVYDEEGKKSDEEEKSVEITSFTAQNEGSWTGKWAEAVLYVKGSAFQDETVKVAVSASGVVGEVYFDTLTYTLISGKDYAAKATDTNKLEMSSSPVADSLPNGNFNLVSSPKTEDVLLPALNWTVNASEKSVSGIVGVDDAYFNHPDFSAKRAKIGLTEKPATDVNGKKNALAILHRENAATKYTSESFSAPEKKDSDGNVVTAEYNRVTVTAANMLATPAAAKAQLLVNDKVMAQIDLTGSRQFQDYVFDIKVNTSNAVKYSIVISVGNTDDSSTFTTGSLWIGKVVIINADKPSVVTGTRVVDLSGDLFSAVKTNDLFAQNYAWDAIYNKDSDAASSDATLGFVKMDGYPSNLAEQYREMFAGSTNAYGMMIAANTPNSVGFKQVFPVTYKDSTYVKVALRVKTRGFDQGQGATIHLGDKAIFKDVNTQYLKASEITEDIFVSNEYSKANNIYSGWREYSFYVNVGAGTTETADETTDDTEDGEEDKPAADSSVTTEIRIMVGDTVLDQRSGAILIDSIRVDTIDENTYADSTKALDNKDEDEVPANLLRVNLRDETKTAVSGATSEDKVLSMDLMLIIIGSTLAGILLIILIVVLIRMLVDRRRTVVAEDKTVSYDRSKVAQNAQKGAHYTPEKKKPEEEEFEGEGEIIEEEASVKKFKQPRTMYGLKRLQKKQANAPRTRRSRRGLSAQQDVELIKELTSPKLPTDEINDFDD